MIKKTAILLAIALTAFGCATSQRQSTGAWAAWPDAVQGGVSSAVAHLQSGDLSAADADLTPQLCASDTVAEYLRAEIAALRGQTPTALERFTAFVEAHPSDPLTPAAVTRLLGLVKASNERPDMKRIYALRVADPYAQSRLVLLANKAASTAGEIAAIPKDIAMPLTHWSWIGPFDGVYSRFDAELPFDADPVLASSYEDHHVTLKPFRYFDDTQMTMAATKSGIYVAETSIHVEKPVDLMVVANSSSFYRIQIDGVDVMERGIDETGTNTAIGTSIHIPAGDHIVRIRLGLNASENAYRQMQVWLSPRPGAKDSSLEGVAELDDNIRAIPADRVSDVRRYDLGYVFGTDTPQASDAWKVWTGAMMAIADGNAMLAESLLVPWLRDHPDDRVAQYWNARRYFVDSDLHASTRSEKAMHELRAVSENAPQIAHAHYYLIAELLRQKQEKMALDVWKEHKNDLPDVADNTYLFAKLANELEWSDLAGAYTAKAAAQAPDSCGLVLADLKLRYNRNDFVAYSSLPERAQACPGIIRFYVEQGVDATLSTDMALQLASDYPNRVDYGVDAVLRNASNLPADGVGKVTEFLRAAERLYYPAPSRQKIFALIDYLRFRRGQAGSDSRWEELWRNILATTRDITPADVEVSNYTWAFEGDTPFKELRLDGMKIIKDYLAQNRSDAGSSVLIMDYAASRFFPDGSEVGITHQIYRVLSKEGKIEVGEIYLPEGAQVLHVRTIKDGTFESIEPENIEFKTSITAPNLAVGDYVEIEYATFDPAATGNGGRLVADAFFFGGANSPYVSSVYVYEYPKDWDIRVVTQDPGHAIDQKCTELAETIRCTAQRHDVPVVIEEPLSAALYDIVPNIMIYHNYDWNFVQSNLRELVSKRTRITPYVRRFYQEIPFAQTDSTWERARTIFDFVMEKIKESDSVSSSNADNATGTVTRGTGSRLMLLKALYDIAGIPSYFALVRSVGSPVQADSLVALYNSTHATELVVETERGPAYVDAEDYVPFDFLSAEFQNRQVIPLDPAKHGFVSRTDAIGDLRSDVTMHYDIAADGSARAQAVENVRGMRGLKMRSFLDSNKNDDRRIQMVIQNMIANSYGRIDLTKFEFPNLAQKQEPLHLDYDFDIAVFASNNGDTLHVPSRIFAYNLAAQYASLPPAERHYPLVLRSEAVTQRTLSFVAPDGFAWDLSGIPDADIDSPFGRYHRHSEIRNGALVVQEDFQILPQRIEVSQYADFRAFCLALDEAQRTVIAANKTE